MPQDLKLSKGTKAQKYASLYPQIAELVKGQSNFIANLANTAAAIHQQFAQLWTGFYLVESQTTLVLGPFQGPVACTRIKKGKGVCGKCWQEQASVIVGDVQKFEGHIACSSKSRSQICVPLFNRDKKFIGLLDIDGWELQAFDQVDRQWLQKILHLIQPEN